MSPRDSLLFCVVAVELGFLNAQELSKASDGWTEREHAIPLDQFLVDSGWMTSEQVREIQRRIEELQDRDSQQTTDLTSSPSVPERNESTTYYSQSRGRYVLTRVQGRGGLGQVWLARDERLERQVAFKEIRPERTMSPTERLRLIREAQITGQLEHPNIVPVYELEADPDVERPYYTMRFLRGESLSTRISECHRAPGNRLTRADLHELLNIFVSICNALAYAHSRGFIHRDLKPSNVMLGDYGEVVVVDWGLAKAIDEQAESPVKAAIVDVSPEEERHTQKMLMQTRDGSIVGTTKYMAPEQAEGRLGDIDVRTDVYGLGAILFEILVGMAPHKASQPENESGTMAMLKRISAAPSPQPREIVPSVSPVLNAICSKAMAKRRRDRYQEASDLAKDVLSWLADEPTSVHRENRLERLARWMRRHRSLAASIAVMLTVVAMASLISVLIVNRARQRVETALESEQTALRQTKQALAEAKEARAEATRRFSEARATVDKFLTGASGIMAYYPGVQPLRQELLREAAADYERFADEKSNDPQLRAEAAVARMRLGDVMRLLAEYERAADTYRRAEEQFVQLAQASIDQAALQFHLVNCRVRMGVVYSATGKLDAANESFDLARAGLDELIEKHSTPEYRVARASIAINQSQLLQSTAQLATAESGLRDAEKELEQLILDDGHRLAQEALAATRKQLGEVLHRMGRNDEAATTLQGAVADYASLLQRQEDHPPYLEGMTGARVILANALRTLGRFDSLIAAYRASIEDYQTLQRIRPGVPQYVEDLALTRTNLAQVLYRLGRCSDAKTDALFALKDLTDLADEHSEVLRYREEIGSCLAIVGMILRDLNEHEWAETAFQDAIDEFARLAETQDSLFYRRRMAVSRSGLGRLQHKLGRIDEAQACFEAAIDELKQLQQDGLADAYTHDALAWTYSHLGDVLLSAGKRSASRVYFAKAAQELEQLTDEAEYLHHRAWFRANCSHPDFRDAPQAISFAEAALRKSPNTPDYLSTKALAYFRDEQWALAVETAEAAIGLRDHENGHDWFVLALALWKLEEKARSQECYERAVSLMEANRPGNIELARLRSEAEAILGQEE